MVRTDFTSILSDCGSVLDKFLHCVWLPVHEKEL